MTEVILKETLAAISHYGDEATSAFYAHLRERRWRSTRCRQCQQVAFPPRAFCPGCHAQQIDWIDLPRTGTLYAFTSQQRSLRFVHPDVIGLVELDGVGKILSHITGSLADLSIGLRVELVFHEISPQLVVHAFRPV